jgi:HK97 family phage portal protein
LPSTELARRQPQHTNALTRAITAPARGLKALTQMVFGATGGVMWRFMPRTRFDYAREVGDGMASSLIMACCLWIARTFPEAPIQIVDQDGEAITPHPLTALLRKPNPFFSGIAMWMATLISWVLDGNAYWVKVRNGVGNVIELWYVPHWMMEPVTDDPNVFITKYRYAVGGEVILLDTSEVVHFRYGLDPRNPRKGLSPLGSLFREVFTDDEAANFAASLLRNCGIPGLIVSPDGNGPPPGDDDVKATKEYVAEEFGGDRRGTPLVMSGPTKVEQFGFNPEEMQVTALRRVPEERVTAVLGLSAMVVGFGAGLERSTFANYAEAREAAYESNIIPTQRLMAEDLRNQLLIPDYQDGQDAGNEVAFDLRTVRVLQDDRNKEADRAQALYDGGTITRAESRRMVGLEATDEDEVYKVGIATTLVPASEVTATQLTGSDAVKARKPRGAKARDGDDARLADRLVEAFGRDRDRVEPVLAQEIELDLDGLGRKAADEYESRAVKMNGRHTKDSSSDESLVEQIIGALNLAEWKDTQLKQRLEAQWLRVAGMTVDTINTVTELGVMLPDPVQKQILDEGGSRRGLIDIEQQTKDAILRAIADGREAGDGPLEIARRIRSQVPAGRFVNAGSKYRAELIARTETLSAQRYSSLAAYKQSPNVTAIYVSDGLLADSDDECVALDGSIVSFEEADSLALDEHPLGTRSFSPVVGSAADTAAANSLAA